MSRDTQEGKLYIYRDSVDPETGDVSTIRTPHYVRLADLEAHIGYTAASVIESLSGIREWKPRDDAKEAANIACAWIKELATTLVITFSRLQTWGLEHELKQAQEAHRKRWEADQKAAREAKSS